jgi:para-aminobenzoate synthetase component I
MFVNTVAAIHSMNTWGAQRKPFFFMVDYTLSQCLCLPLHEAANHGICFKFNNVSNFTPKTVCETPRIQSFPVDFESYLKAFETVKEHLYRGNSYLVNLTFSTPINCDLSLSQIFDAAQAQYKLMVENQFVVFSPETFVKIENGTIKTYPMKGTQLANGPEAHDQILNNAKELAEHATIVDLLRNDLSTFSNNVQVSKFRYIDEIVAADKTLLQVSSEIEGQLPTNYHQQLGSILFSMLPAGSVTGAPKAKTLEIIAEAETHQRGFYTGVAGVFDGQNLDSCVLIRFIENQNGQLVFKSGGGITAQSDARSEYQELKDKIYVPIG